MSKNVDAFFDKVVVKNLDWWVEVSDIAFVHGRWAQDNSQRWLATWQDIMIAADEVLKEKG